MKSTLQHPLEELKKVRTERRSQERTVGSSSLVLMLSGTQANFTIFQETMCLGKKAKALSLGLIHLQGEIFRP